MRNHAIKTLIAMNLALFVQPSLAMSIAGKDFAAVADTFKAQAPGAVFSDNDTTQTPSQSITDTNPASGILSESTPAYMDLAFSTDVFDGAGADLSVLFLGNDGDHVIDLTLFKVGGATSDTLRYSMTPTLANYTGLFVDNNGNGVPDDGIDVGIYAMDIDLADFAFLGADPLDKFRMDISGYGAVPSLVGAYPTTASPVPVPAAAWLFGSGLVALAGVVRKRS